MFQTPVSSSQTCDIRVTIVSDTKHKVPLILIKLLDKVPHLSNNSSENYVNF